MKTPALALAALLIAGGLSVPAFAADESSFDSDYLVTQLQQRGINATNVYQSGDNIVRADVKLADGSTVFQDFYDDTLAPVRASTGPNTRVLSKLDTGVVKAPTVTDSLLYEGDHSH